MRSKRAVALGGLIFAGLVAGGVERQSVVRAAELKPVNAGESANLVVNGSFEEGPEVRPDGYLPLDEDSTDLRGWVVTRGQIDLVQEAGERHKPAHGKRSLDLHGSPGFGGVKQSIATKVGQKYRVTFGVSGNAGIRHDAVQLAVRAAGKKAVFECDMVGKSLEHLKWEQKEWEFTATDATTVLEFHTAMAPFANPFGGPMLDDVKVVAVE